MLNNRTQRRAFTLTELLVVIALMGILASMLLPTLSRAREMGRRASCVSNLRQIGLSAQMYVQDNDEGFLPSYGSLSEVVGSPPSCQYVRIYDAWWGEILQPYLKNTEVFVCPSARGSDKVKDPIRVFRNTCPPGHGSGSGGGHGSPGPTGCPPLPPHEPNPPYYSYAFNAISDNDVFWTKTPQLASPRNGFSTDHTTVDCAIAREAGPISFVAVQIPERTIWLADAELSNGTLPQPELFDDTQLDYPATVERLVSQRHMGSFNALFADGHVKWLSHSEPAQWTVQDD